jgi:KaiC/GvpD/RAD55 family RecA-like ATPase
MSCAVAELAHSLSGKMTGHQQWLAPCPYHEDKSPSLSIGEGDDGRVLVHCHAGCENVFERLLDDGHIERPRSTRAEAEPEARYQYVDASGTLAYEVVRLPAKQFRARRPTDDGSWTWDVPEDLRVPYRLPEVLQASQVFIVEGEKDADTLANHGYVATTNPFGAGKWRSQYNPHFSGRNVIIVPDNDEPGRKHAEAVRQQLEPVAASVRILTLAGAVPEKGDVSDLIDADGIASFVRLLERLPPPELKHKPYLRIRDLADLPRREWLVDGLLPKGGVSLLFGESGVGKSFVAIDMSVRIAAGESVLDRPTASGPVFYVALEGHTGLYDRFRAVCEEIGVLDADHLRLVVRTRSLDLLSSDSVGELISAVQSAAADRHTGAALVVIDTLSRAMPGADENSPGVMNGAVTALTRVQHETGAAVLVIHHSGKTAERGARGHSSLRAAVDAELLVSRDKLGRALTVTKQRDGADLIKVPFDLIPVADGDGTVTTLIVRPLEPHGSQQMTRLKAAAQKALKALKEALRASGKQLEPAEADALQVPRGARVVGRSQWLEACREVGLSKGTADAVRKAMGRAANELRDVGLLAEAGEFVWLNP